MKFPMSKAQFDWWMDNIATPAAPLAWFRRFQAGSGAARVGLAAAKYLVLIFWAVFFIWVWFPVFALLFLVEGLGLAPWTRSSAAPAPPAESHH